MRLAVLPLLLLMMLFVSGLVVVLLPRRRVMGVFVLAALAGLAIVFLLVPWVSFREHRMPAVPATTELSYLPAPPATPVIEPAAYRSFGKTHRAEVVTERDFSVFVPGHHPAETTESSSSEGALARIEEIAEAAAKPPVDLPSWVKEAPDRTDGKLAFVLTSDPFDTPLGCDNDMAKRTRHAFDDLVKEICRQRGYDEDITIPVTERDLRDVSQERYYAQRNTSLGEMTQLHQLTAFDHAVQARVQARVDRAMSGRRVEATSVVTGGALVLVGVLFTCCRFASRNAKDPFSGEPPAKPKP